MLGSHFLCLLSVSLYFHCSLCDSLCRGVRLSTWISLALCAIAQDERRGGTISQIVLRNVLRCMGALVMYVADDWNEVVS